MHWLLVGYMFLFIHRPFEVWPWLGDLRVERIYMLLTLAIWAVLAPKRWLPNLQHFAYATFATAVLACWAASPWGERSQPAVEDWLKILVFYVLLVTTVFDERGLKRVVVGFLCVMTFYLLHSLREYIAGRHTYRMGIARMIGVDTTLGDPNSFGASIVFVLPFVTAFWRSNVGGKLGKYALCGYVMLSVLCVLLTGSRSSLLGVAAWFGLLLLRANWRKAIVAGFAAALLAPAVFFLLPDSLQTRFETIVNPDVGPANARTSGEGRIQGLFMGLELWAANPLTGIGPGAWRPATGSAVESHNLYGQLLGETGTMGAIGFVMILCSFWLNLRRIATIRRAVPEWQNDFVFQISAAIGTSIILLLFMGNFGHNLFRFSWLWYGGFLIIARYCIEQRVRALLTESDSWDAMSQDDNEREHEGIPEGWEQHSGHEPGVTN